MTLPSRHGTPPGFRLLPTLALLLLLASAGCDDSTGPGEDIEDPPREFILFVRGTGPAHDYSADIFRMKLDGTGLENLTEHPARYSGLHLSPDGTRVTFHADRGGECIDVWSMTVDGTDLRQYTSVDSSDRCNYDSRWSPDGSMIAFFSSRDAQEGRGWDAYVVGADGTGLTEVGGNPSTDLGTNSDMTDGWSPDGRVVLLSDRDGTKRTYLVNPDGTGREHFADGYVSPFWSPDGTRVLCLRESEPGEAQLHVMNADGTGDVNVSAHAGWNQASAWGPTPWSPDGSRIAFMSDRNGAYDVFVVNPDGTVLTNVTDHPANEDFLSWSPDGTRILFRSNRSGNQELYVMEADGSGVTRLTDDPADDGKAVWVSR